MSTTTEMIHVITRMAESLKENGLQEANLENRKPEDQHEEQVMKFDFNKRSQDAEPIAYLTPENTLVMRDVHDGEIIVIYDDGSLGARDSFEPEHAEVKFYPGDQILITLTDDKDNQ